jgi:dynein intermediate chain 2
MISKYHPAYLTDCVWTVRTGLYIVSRSDGWINAYDLCYKINECAFSYKVCDSSIVSISINSKGDKLVVGDEEGKVYLIKLSKSFYSQQDFDKKKAYINTLFDRETLREKDLNKKKPVVVKDDNTKATRLEQTIKERVRNIDENYANMLNEILQKTNLIREAKE